MATEQITLERIDYVEPNDFFEDSKSVDLDNLNKYVNLSVFIPSRYYLDNGKNYTSILSGTKVNNGNSEIEIPLFTTSVMDVSYNEVNADGITHNGELLGITSINISFDAQFFPIVNIDFTDIRGMGLIGSMDDEYNKQIENNSKSFFKSLFNFPYPKFTLEVKGYYGKSVSFDLSVSEFNTFFDSNTGNFNTKISFIGYMYGVYGDIPLSYALISPYIFPEGNLKNNVFVEGDNPTARWLTYTDNLITFMGLGSKCYEVFNKEGYDTTNIEKYHKDVEKLNVLKEINTIYENIINVNKDSKVNSNGEILYNQEHKKEFLIFFKANDANYQKLQEIILNEKYKKYALDLIEDDKKNIKFSNLLEKKRLIEREINTYDDRTGSEYEFLNEEIVGIITKKIGFEPNIKNIYEFLNYHLTYFSMRFFEVLKNISNKKDTIKDLGLEAYKTDIKEDDNHETIVPPFPGVVNVNEKNDYIYPGLINGFKNREEILLTETIYNSLLYFNRNNKNILNELNDVTEKNYNVNYKETLFFNDLRTDIKTNEKHYNILNNKKYKLTNPRDIADNICKIFCARYATATRLFNVENIDIPSLESELLLEAYTTLYEDYPNFIDYIREYSKIKIYQLFDEFYGKLIINYKPDGEVTEDDKIRTNGDILILEQGSLAKCANYYNQIGFTSRKIGLNEIVNEYNDNEKIDNIVEFLRSDRSDYFTKSWGTANVIPKSHPFYNDQCACDIYGKMINSFKTTLYSYTNQYFIVAIPYTYYIGKTTIKWIADEKYKYYNKIGFNHINKISFLSSDGDENVTVEKDSFNKIALISKIQLAAIGEALSSPEEKKVRMAYISDKTSLFKGDNVFSKNSEYYKHVNNFYEFDILNNDFKELAKKCYNEYSNDNIESFGNTYYLIAKSTPVKTSDPTRLLNYKTTLWNYWESFIENIEKGYGIVKQGNYTEKTYVNRKKEEEKLEIKTNIYYTLKILYDKWFNTLNEKDINLFEADKIKFLDTNFSDISNELNINLLDFIINTNNSLQSGESFLGFMSNIAQNNGCNFISLPYNFFNTNMKDVFKTYSFPERGVKSNNNHPTYIIMRNTDTSHYLEIDGDTIKNDSYDIANIRNGAMSEEVKILYGTKNENDSMLKAFGVTYGMQNQNFFKSININTNNPSITDYSIANTLALSESGSDLNKISKITKVSLYPVYANRTYTCEVEMMGCMNISPLMHFQLNNVPMFRGVYMIIDVKHRITPDDFVTTFTGVRVSKYRTPVNKKVLDLEQIKMLRDNSVEETNYGYEANNIYVTPPYGVENDIINLDKEGNFWIAYHSEEGAKKINRAVPARPGFDDCLQNCYAIYLNYLGAYYEKNEDGNVKYDTTKYKLGNSDEIIRLLYEKNGSLYYNEYNDKRGNAEYRYRAVLRTIISHLTDNRPIIVGTNHTINRGINHDGTTDHFVLIYAYGKYVGDKITYNNKEIKLKDAYYFRYYETAFDDPNRGFTGTNNQNNYFILDPQQCMFFNPNACYKERQDVVHIRPISVNHSPLLESMTSEPNGDNIIKF